MKGFNNMKTLPFSALSAIFCTGIILLQGGCVLTTNPHYESKAFDLAMPSETVQQSFFRLSAFQNETPSRNRMLYRNSDNRIIQDEYNTWVQPPELMLNRFMQIAYPVAPEAENHSLPDLRIRITAFEFNLATSEAILVVNYTLRNHQDRSQGCLAAREKFTDFTPEAMSQAMSKAASKIGQDLLKAAENFTKNSQ